MKLFYLQKLFKNTLRFSNSVKSFYDIASLSILEVDKRRDIDSKKENKDSNKFIVIHPETVLRLFRSIGKRPVS